jgi:flagellar basal-body rod modification protein FlgD
MPNTTPISNQVPSTYTPTNQPGVVTNKTGGMLDKDGFLKLLVGQLRQQDPMNAQGSEQMMAQMTQLSLVEQVTNLTKANERLVDSQTTSQALSLVGKDVKFTPSSGGGPVSGKVMAVEFEDGIGYLKIEGQTENIKMGQVTEAS